MLKLASLATQEPLRRESSQSLQRSDEVAAVLVGSGADTAGAGLDAAAEGLRQVMLMAEVLGIQRAGVSSLEGAFVGASVSA
jgi:hypothetical protein